jgi:O-succinylbenzoate synthase
LGVGWWVTSALESNIGLNAIAQWVATLGVNMPQGFGPGQLYRNNIPSPLEISKGKLYYRQHKDWDLG